MVNRINISEESWNDFIEKVITKNFQYNRYTIFPALECIMTHIQTICEIYRRFPNTCIELLNQVVAPFTPTEYEEKVINPILALAAQEPALELVANSLRTLRHFFGDYPDFLNRTFQHQIRLMQSENKLQTFVELCKKLCTDAVTETVNSINQSLSNVPSLPSLS